MTQARNVNAESQGLTHSVVIGDIRLPDLFRDLPDAVIVADSNRKITWVNPAFETLFGYCRDDVLGQETRALYADQQQFEEQIRDRYAPDAEQTEHSYEMRYRHKQGRVFLTQTTGGPIRSRDGALLGYFGIIKDITKARAIEDLLRSLFHISSDQNMDTNAKVHAILKLGCAHFETDSAIVSWVRDEDYTILYSYSELVDIPRGTRFDLGETYCSKMLESGLPLACHSAKHSNFASHPCYDIFLLETYIGVPLVVDGQLFGTLNFSSPEERHPFEPGDLEMIKLFAAWIGQQLSFEKATNQLPS